MIRVDDQEVDRPDETAGPNGWSKGEDRPADTTRCVSATMMLACGRYTS